MINPNNVCISLCLSILFRCAIGDIRSDKFDYQSTENARTEESTFDYKDMEAENAWETKSGHELYVQNLISDFVNNLESKLSKLEENVLEKLEDYIDRKLDTSDFEKHALVSINKKLSSLEKKMHSFEENQYCKLDVFERRIEIAMEKKVAEALKNLSNCKDQLADSNKQLDNVIKQYETMLLTYKTNTNRVFYNRVMNTISTTTDHINHKSIDSSEEMLPGIKPKDISYSTTDLAEALDSSYSTTDLAEVLDSSDRCKEEFSHGYRWTAHELDSSAFNHTIVEKNDTGVSYFEMHIAIKAARDGIVVLSPVTHPDASDLVFEIAIGVYNNVRTDLRLTVGAGENALMLETQAILSPYHYKAFYIKISDGSLKFGVEGNPPLISHDNPGLSAVKYIFFTTWNFNQAQFLIDCPAPFKDEAQL